MMTCPFREIVGDCVLAKLVRPERFELLTYSSGGCRSIQLSYGRAADLSSAHRSHGRLNVGIPVETRLAASCMQHRGRRGKPVSTMNPAITLRPPPSNPASAYSIAEPSCAGAETSA